ncbi:MAG: insulinase family protein [Candidatus Omnitrophica bacterium]|nr:insulinase family protein [Candidatus Omnitrophota bacterium]MBU1128638.1 insulinase family protein [Candidatus Omnitrophota bacterium]MBU1657032.1 insulinase family protein [Candidatus Omnitrophota bacterium]MBU1785019.1 insulinase family protein [Candidatus Omnitrophota bacterium]MBU1852232.1 insulinase family protein [Candidatus Omnitrophota bacterium]
MYKKHQLNNGLKIIASPMPHMNSVSLGIWIGVGGRYESARESGISHLVEHMLFKGTWMRSARELKESVEGVGGSLNGFTADEATCYMVKVPSHRLKLGLDILTDMVFNARFDKEDIDREKLVVLEEIKMYKDQPAERVMEILCGTMWPANALGRPLTGTIATVKSFKRNDIIKFKENNYHPANMAVIASGKLAPETVIEYASNLFKGTRRKKASFETPNMGQKCFRARFSQGDTNQTHLAMGFYAVAKNMRERFAMKLMSVILGGNMSSRLFEELREKHGLCYDIGSAYKRHRDVGEFVIHAGVDNKKALKAVVAILDELRKIRDAGATGGELSRTKEFVKGQFQLALENTSARMMWFGDRLMLDGNIPSPESILEEVDRITGDDIKKACERIFKTQLINLAVVGKTSLKDKNQMKKALGAL